MTVPLLYPAQLPNIAAIRININTNVKHPLIPSFVLSAPNNKQQAIMMSRINIILFTY